MRNLATTFAVLAPDLRVTPVENTPDVYERLDRDFAGFRGHVLVAKHAFKGDWPTWERHPAGDEVVVLLSGAVEFLLDKGGREEALHLTVPGSYVIVPRATWHTARIATPTELLFITPGEGTENEVRE